MDVKSGKTIFNENKVKMLGYSIEDFKDVDYTAFTDIVHPDDHKKVMKAMQDHLDGKKDLYEIDYRIKTKKGNYKWFYDRGSIVERGKKGEPLTVKGVVFDITDLKEAENKLKYINENLENLVIKRTKELEDLNKKLTGEVIERRNAEEYSNRIKQNLRNIIDSASEIIISLDMNHRVTIWNKIAENITGYKQIEVLNRSIGKLDVFDDVAKVKENIDLICGSKKPNLSDITLKTKSNNKSIIRVTGTEILSSKNECVGVLLIGRDITKEIELHKKLLSGNSYLITDKNNSSAIDLISSLTINDFKVLIITRGNPDQIKRQINKSKNIETILLSGDEIRGLLNISNFEELEVKFNEFTKSNNKSVVLLDGVHYLISRFSFDKFIEFLYDINDIVAKNKSILFVRIDPSTIDSKQLAIIENELLILPSQKTDDLIIEDNIFDILKYIYQENQDSSIVSVKKIKQKFNISYVTTASRLDMLEKKGLIFTKKQGKLRAIYITDKGKKFIHKRVAA